MEIREGGEGVRDGASEAVTGEGEDAKLVEEAELGRDGAGDYTGGEKELGEGGERGDGPGEETSKPRADTRGVPEGEDGDTEGVGGAGDAREGEAGVGVKGGEVPGGEEGGAREVGEAVFEGAEGGEVVGRR